MEAIGISNEGFIDTHNTTKFLIRSCVLQRKWRDNGGMRREGRVVQVVEERREGRGAGCKRENGGRGCGEMREEDGEEGKGR
ncbi:glucan endo-1,3-beta-glucosidase 12-like [Pyrus ussuriensis x Pyrus communis]|uniref:Glucan endo-1,3-beta-glucosidase 12-like n=1 Tax=Pyrus ussuriensis x Pyrus communis TaxID=2448454 RepID=A0A5N5F4Q3_9ROSA|nr:glucan endo-1,3-beta-glucosidase 12-like [Pyrus ussuriensis x Pyrus communis]